MYLMDEHWPRWVEERVEDQLMNRILYKKWLYILFTSIGYIYTQTHIPLNRRGLQLSYLPKMLKVNTIIK